MLSTIAVKNGPVDFYPKPGTGDFIITVRTARVRFTRVWFLLSGHRNEDPVRSYSFRCCPVFVLQSPSRRRVEIQ